MMIVERWLVMDESGFDDFCDDFQYLFNDFEWLGNNLRGIILKKWFQ